MSLIVRIDVDRPYGRSPWLRHVLSRISSDLYLPKITGMGYLAELQTMLGWLNQAGARAYVFFRRCSLPSQPVLDLLDTGCHEIGLHLEDSRSFASFVEEKDALEHHVGKKVRAFSKHGSGRAKYGFHHYAPYEPEKYVEWARRASLHLFLGNLEDPRMEPIRDGENLLIFPSAFWLEPAWRDTQAFTVEWLLDRAKLQDVVLLVHPDNVLAEPGLVADFKMLIGTVESKIDLLSAARRPQAETTSL